MNDTTLITAITTLKDNMPALKNSKVAHLPMGGLASLLFHIVNVLSDATTTLDKVYFKPRLSLFRST